MPGHFLADHDAFVRWAEIGEDGPPLVWLPGIGFPAVGNFLTTVTQAPFRTYRSVLIDPPGVGASDRVAGPGLSIPHHADVVAAVLDHLGYTACTLIGYSMGGAIAAELCLRRPDLVSRVILAEGNLKTGGGRGTRHMAGVDSAEFRDTRLPDMLADLRKGALDGEAVDDFILASWARIDPETLHGMAQALVDIRPDLLPDFLALQIPRFYIFGENNLADQDGFAATNLPAPDVLSKAGVTVTALPDVGHDLMLTDPGGFAALAGPMLPP